MPWHGLEIEKTDGMLLMLDTASDAAGYALAYQQALAHSRVGTSHFNRAWYSAPERRSAAQPSEGIAGRRPNHGRERSSWPPSRNSSASSP